MTHKGKLISWKDDKGFGFIEPCLDSREVFVHISSFQNRSRRPRIGDVVVYEIAQDSNGKLRALSVSLSGEIVSTAKQAPSEWGLMLTMIISFIFLGVIGVLGFSGRIPLSLALMYVAASFVAFMMYWHDKSAARNGRWRTQENSLLLCGLVGGWPGALIAQRLFRHKSSKIEFQVSFWVTVAVNCCALGWLISPAGAEILSLFM